MIENLDKNALLSTNQWVNQRKDKQAQKGSLRIMCFELAFWLK